MPPEQLKEFNEKLSALLKEYGQTLQIEQKIVLTPVQPVTGTEPLPTSETTSNA